MENTWKIQVVMKTNQQVLCKNWIKTYIKVIIITWGVSQMIHTKIFTTTTITTGHKPVQPVICVSLCLWELSVCRLNSNISANSWTEQQTENRSRQHFTCFEITYCLFLKAGRWKHPLLSPLWDWTDKKTTFSSLWWKSVVAGAVGRTLTLMDSNIKSR